MNPGILSLILLVIALILLSSGWKDLLLRSISRKGILLFFMLWLALSRIALELGSWKLNLAFALVVLHGLLLWLQADGTLPKLHVLSIGLLLGSFHFLLGELLNKDPILIVSRPDIDIAVLLGLITVILQRSVSVQLACLSLGLSLGEVYDKVLFHKGGGGTLGSPSFCDQWWVAVFVSRGATLVVQGTAMAGKGMVQLWTTRKRSSRK